MFERQCKGEEGGGGGGFKKQMQRVLNHQHRQVGRSVLGEDKVKQRKRKHNGTTKCMRYGAVGGGKQKE